MLYCHSRPDNYRDKLRQESNLYYIIIQVFLLRILLIYSSLFKAKLVKKAQPNRWCEPEALTKCVGVRRSCRGGEQQNLERNYKCKR